VVLPTGAGKTAVLMLAPYLLRATRALVITQSRFVRAQIAADFRALRTLKKAKALPETLEPPRVFENRRRMSTPDAWEAVRDFEVVISTPNATSPGMKGVAPPPPDLFDLVLIDEAHHSAARTWNVLLDAFPHARAVLFTATPFRRDRKEIRGRHVYTYPIQRAFDDGIYGEMVYLPVQPTDGLTGDVALARETARVFREDAAAGHTHAVMVRAETRGRADELVTIYARETNLSLEVVHSQKSQRETEKVVSRLRAGELDGVICVNMLGEGFDLPNLKIAALHAPHRSLAVTLQFFGRFARVNGDHLGDATFLAVPEEIGNDLDALFKDSEAWGRRIRTIGQARIGAEVFRKEFIEEFEPNPDVVSDAAVEDLSLYSFTLFNHVKIFQAHGDVDLHAVPTLAGFRTERAWVNDPHSTATFLVREEVRPKWATTNGVDRIEHHLFVVHHDEQANLLFICATYREESVYREVASIFVSGYAQPLSLNRINRILRSYQDLELFHVGMRNRATGTVAETYRQLAGSGVHHSIAKGDSALYHRGHVFGRGVTPTGTTTVGLSSLSKVWRLEQTKIPDLVQWLGTLARDIENPTAFTTGIQLDHLDAGADLDTFPKEIVLAADWHEVTYRTTPIVRMETSDVTSEAASVLDTDLVVDRAGVSADAIPVTLTNGERSTRLTFSLHPYPAFRYLDDAQPRWAIQRSHRHVDMATYLTDHPLRFHLADGSLIQAGELFVSRADELPFDTEAGMTVVDWAAAGVDISREFGACAPPLVSIHDWLGSDLVASDAAIVFYDHRSGECADFLTVDVNEEGEPTIRLYHCKGAGGAPSGERVTDLYDVCGQVTKSVQWRSRKRLVAHVRKRLASGSQFLKGDLDQFAALVGTDVRFEFPLEIIAVQPGVARHKLAPRLATLLATVDRGIVSFGCRNLQVICSE
jgi:superfamily II DNA or RNA helicase